MESIWRSIQFRLLVLTLATLLPAFAVIVFSEYKLVQARELEIRQDALRSAMLAATELERFNDGIRNLFTAIAMAPVVQAQKWSECSQYLARIVPSLPHLTGMSIVDSSGVPVCNSTVPSAAVNYGDRAYFQDALRTGGFVVGQYVVGRVSGQPVLTLAMGIKNNGDANSLVVIAGLRLDWLGEQMLSRVPAGGSLTIADKDGTIISRNPLPERFVGTKIPDAFQNLVNAPEPGVVEVNSQDGTKRILGYVPLASPPVGLYVSAGLSEAASFEAVNQTTRQSLLIALCGAAAALASSWLVGRKVIATPLANLLRTVDLWRNGEDTPRTGLNETGGEIGILGARLDGMMDEIAAQKDRNKLLALELQHRVKNNIAVIQAIARITFSKPDRGQDAISEFSARLQALSKAHDVLVAEKGCGARLKPVVAEAVAPLAGDAGGLVRISGENVAIGPRHLVALSMILHELGTNALKYGALSRPGGSIGISWSVMPASDGTAVSLIWREFDGPEVATPDTSGFGSKLIKRGFGSEFDSIDLQFAKAGVICEIKWIVRGDDLDLHSIAQNPAPDGPSHRPSTSFLASSRNALRESSRE